MSKMQIKLEKFRQALTALEQIYLNPPLENRVNIDATIQRFEFTFELAWKFLKDYFAERGLQLNYPKEIIMEAFAVGLIDDEATWITMLADRNLTTHTYDEKLANEIYMRIRKYVPQLRKLLDKVS